MTLQTFDVGDIAQQLRALATLVEEDLSSIHPPTSGSSKHPYAQLQGI